MPDNDIVPRVVRGPYRQVARSALGFMPADQVGDLLCKAVAWDLRRSKLPPAGGLADALHRAAVSGELSPWQAEARRFGRTAGDRQLAQAIVTEGDVLLETRRAELQRMGEGDLSDALVQGGLRRMAYTRTFGPAKITQDMVSHTDRSIADIHQYQRDVVDNAQLDALARTAATGTTEKLRAPRSRVRATTAEMLNEPLE